MKTVTYHGEVFENYSVDKLGFIFSLHTGNDLTPFVDKGNKGCKYPRVSLRYSDKNKSKTVLVHRVVAEAYVPLKRPEDSNITAKEWAETPESVKQFIMKTMWVNHIDHDKTNYDPSNLEWVTPTQNARARNDFYGI